MSVCKAIKPWTNIILPRPCLASAASIVWFKFIFSIDELSIRSKSLGVIYIVIKPFGNFFNSSFLLSINHRMVESYNVKMKPQKLRTFLGYYGITFTLLPLKPVCGKIVSFHSKNYNRLGFLSSFLHKRKLKSINKRFDPIPHASASSFLQNVKHKHNLCIRDGKVAC